MIALGRLWITLVAVLVFSGSFSAPYSVVANTKAERSMRIQEVKSPGGIVAWLVEEHSVPLIAMRFSFEGGSAQDPADRPGVSNFLTTMLDEGAGELTSEAFQERAEEIAMRLSFTDGRDAFFGSFETLTQNKDAAAEMLYLALTRPRFDPPAIERMRKQLLSRLAFAAKNPNRVADKVWSELAYPSHPYGRPSSGTPESVAAIDADDLENYRSRVFARDNLKIAVVGDIDAEALGRYLDRIFGDLPGTAQLKPVPDIELANPGRTEVVAMPVPQSVVIAGTSGIARDDPDFVPAYVMNHILGGGGFSSRLMNEVREKRGLAYSVFSYLSARDHGAAIVAQVATKNEKVSQSIEVIRREMRRLAETDVSQEDLDNAKSYLTGSYPLRFDTNSKIANQLLGIQQEGLGIDYVDRRNDLIKAVTKEDIRRLARRLLKADDLVIVVVGQPKNIHSGG
ncbi:MAG: M16 family metallopeptidase [Hyphomicrobiaceae bacterium]